jgi:Zn-dependent peptidase ImmA (M78 family)/transcriptional regulator with XRE-family HTH domain
MPITKQELGNRLRLLRENRGYTQEDVAAVLGISRSAVVQLEGGNRNLDSVELMTLANEFGFDPKQLFEEKFDAVQDSVTALFRSDADLATSKELTHAVSQWSTLCRQFTNLEKLVGADRKNVSPAQYDLLSPKSKWEAIQQGSLVADYERNRLRLGSSPLLELPEVIESQGVRVGHLPLDDTISGLFLADHANGLAILVNAKHSEQRQLFSFAHEYGHLLFDRQVRGNVSRLADREQLSEIRANSFAATLLLPEQGVREFLSSAGKSRDFPLFQEIYDEGGAAVRAQRREASGPIAVQFYDVVHLAFYFGVSYESALWRLKTLKLISEEERLHLASQNESASEFRKLLWMQSGRPQRSAIREGKFQHKLLMLALEAFRLGEISHAKLREVAKLGDISPEQLDTFVASIEPEDHTEAKALLPN